MTIQRLGPHIQNVTPAGLVWSRAAPVVKAIDATAPFYAAPSTAFLVFRHYFPQQDINRPGEDVAREVLAALGTFRHPNLYVELFNEIAPSGDALRAHLQLVRAAVPILHAASVKVAAFSFATGNVDLHDWLFLRDQEYGNADALSIHEYWGNQGFSTWNALRYRRVHEWTNGNHPPILITECGRDAIEGGAGGWRKDGISADQYVAELTAYDAELQKDSYVLGAMVFTAGPSPDWAGFDVDPIAERIAASTSLTGASSARSAPISGGSPMKIANIGGVEVFDVRERFPYVAGRTYDTRPLSAVTMMVQHHMGSPLPIAMTSDEALRQLDITHNWHTSGTREWPDEPHPWPAIGYHFAIDGEGRIYWCNGLELVSYHARAANAYGVGCVWLGTFDVASPPAKMIEGSRRLLKGLDFHLNRSLGVIGHYEAPTNQTTCPGVHHWPVSRLAILRPEVDTGALEREVFGPLWKVQTRADELGRSTLALSVRRAVVADKERVGL